MPGIHRAPPEPAWIPPQRHWPRWNPSECRDRPLLPMSQLNFFRLGFFAVIAGVLAAHAEPVVTGVFISGQDGYHTHRIPALVVTTNGTALAFCEGRKHSRSDTGDIDL